MDLTTRIRLAPKPSEHGGLLLRAEALAGDLCNSITPEQAIEMIKSGEGTVWLDIQVSDRPAAEALLQDRLGFHELAVEDAVSDHERPTLHIYDNVLFLSATAVTWNQHRLSTTELGIFLTENAIVTVSREPIKTIDEWMGLWKHRPKSVGDSPSEIAYVLLDGIVDDYFPIMEEIEDTIDDLIEAALAGEMHATKRILAVKRQLIAIRKALSPLRDVLNGLLRRDIPHLKPEIRPYLADVYDHVLRLAELVDTDRDSLTGLLDVQLSATSNSLNLVMKKMTVLSTVLMTMALIAGIYGMNFEGMPELHWTYGYPFALGLMVLSGVLVVWIFRRVRWL